MKGCCEDMGEMKGKMSEMMEGCSPEMMMEMMPECLGMMLSKLPQEQRSKMVKKLLTVLKEKEDSVVDGKDKTNEGIDDRTKELIAIGASVTANCQPCLEYHVGEAKKLEIGEEDIQEAVETGQMVKKGAMRKYNEFMSAFFAEKMNPANDSCCGG